MRKTTLIGLILLLSGCRAATVGVTVLWTPGTEPAVRIVINQEENSYGHARTESAGSFGRRQGDRPR